MVDRLLNLCGWKRRAVVSKPLLAPHPAPEWTSDDAKQLLTFFQNPTGQALLQRARAKQAADAITACKGDLQPQFAAGFGHAIDWLESLALSGNTASARSNDAADTRESETSGAVVPEFALP